MNRRRTTLTTALAAVLTALTCAAALTAPAQATTPAPAGGPAPDAQVTPSQRAEGAVTALSARVARFTKHHHGRLPSRAAGHRLAQVVTGTGPVFLAYAPNRAGTVYCAMSVAPGMSTDRAWFYDSVLDTVFAADLTAVPATAGACAAVTAERAAGPRSPVAAAQADAWRVALVVESTASDGRGYPTELSDPTTLGVDLAAGDTLASYRYRPATALVAASFRLCVTHTRGAWAVYDSTRGALVAAGTTGGACGRQTLAGARRDALTRDVTAAGDALVAGTDLAADGGYPSRLGATALPRLGVVLPAGETVGFYQPFLTSAGAPAFRMCLVHRWGGWATYTSVDGLLGGAGAGRACRFDPTRAEVYRTRAVADAAAAGRAVTGYARHGGLWPRDLAEARTVVAQAWALSARGNLLTRYAYRPASGDATPAFRLCVTHAQGAWAVYDSTTGSVVASGKFGKTCDTAAATG